MKRPPCRQDDAHGEIDRDKAAAIITEVRKSGRTILTEFESKKLLAAYGIPTVETHIATDRKRRRESRPRDSVSRSC